MRSSRGPSFSSLRPAAYFAPRGGETHTSPQDPVSPAKATTPALLLPSFKGLWLQGVTPLHAQTPCPPLCQSADTGPVLGSPPGGAEDRIQGSLMASCGQSPALLRDCYLLPVRCVLICDMRCCCLTPDLREGQRGRGWHARGGTEPCPPLPGLKPGRRLPRPPRAWQVLGRAPSPGSGQSPGGLTGSLPKLLMPQLLLCPGGQRDFCPSLHAEG